MKRNLIIVLLAAITLGGCGAATVNNSSDTSKKESGIVTETQKVENKLSLKELIAGGKDQKCTWKYEIDGQQMEGSLLISGKKFKQEIVMDMEIEGTKKTTKITNLSDGEYLYMWNNETKEQGIKMRIPEEDKEGLDKQENGQGKVDWEGKYEYKCDNWKAGANDLTPPKDIQFQDFEEQMKQLKELQEKFGGSMKLPENP